MDKHILSKPSSSSRFKVFGRGGGRRSITKMASWNVRSAQTRERMEQIILYVGNKHIDLCALQETRGRGLKETFYRIRDYSKDIDYEYKLISSGTDDGRNHVVG